MQKSLPVKTRVLNEADMQKLKMGLAAVGLPGQPGAPPG